MNPISVNSIDINQVLQEMQALRARTQGRSARPQAVTAASPPLPQSPAPSVAATPMATTDPTSIRPDFGRLLRGAIDQVNDTALTSAKAQNDFQRGEGEQDLAAVMIASERAGLTFDAMTQVRNRLVTAYEEIMKMQV